MVFVKVLEESGLWMGGKIGFRRGYGFCCVWFCCVRMVRLKERIE